MLFYFTLLTSKHYYVYERECCNKLKISSNMLSYSVSLFFFLAFTSFIFSGTRRLVSVLCVDPDFVGHDSTA